MPMYDFLQKGGNKKPIIAEKTLFDFWGVLGYNGHTQESYYEI